MNRQDKASPAPAVPDTRLDSRQDSRQDSRPRSLRLEALALVVLSCGGASLSAGPLADPTRPPGNLASPGAPAHPGAASPARVPSDAAAQTAARQAAAAAAAATAAATPPLPPLAGLLLQSVQSPARGPALAIINGQLVKTGDPVAGRLVAAIDAQGVLLKGSQGDERLWLLGDGAKQAAGSILGSRSTQFTPAQDKPEADATAEAPTRTERSSTPGPLSLARRTQP